MSQLPSNSLLKDNPSAFGWISIGFHWICAIIILFLFGLGVYMRGLDYYSPWYHKGPELHIALGILVFVLMLLRLIWRAKNITPEALPGQSRYAILAAKLIKIALYLLVFLVCITGYLVTTAKGQGTHFFNWFSIPATIELSPSMADLAEATHKYAAWCILILAGLHVGAALIHHFILRDKTLVRMLKASQQH